MRSDGNGRAFDALAGLAACAGPFALRWLIGTCRLTVVNRVRCREVFAGTPYVGALWHQHILAYGHLFRGSRVVIMVSRSRDGEIASRALRRLGMDTVRGSSTSGGAEALREIVRAAERGRSIAFIADGPRGPAREAKPGVVLAARQSARPILPIGCAMGRAVRAASWDRTEIPVPYSRIVVAFGEPVRVPADASREECERIRRDVQQTINRLEERARAAL